MATTHTRYDLLWTPDHPDLVGWKARHRAALRAPTAKEAPMVTLLRGWLDYARQHHDTYDSPIGEDRVLGPEWAAIGASIRKLLNGDCGRLDCDTIDSLICGCLTEQGFNPDEL